MKILITGATGLVGKEIGKALFAKGHDLVVVSRNPHNAQKNLPFPCEIIKWQGESEDFPLKALEGTEALIHLAGESIGEGRWSTQRKKAIENSRVLGTRMIVEALKKQKKQGTLTLRSFISTSAIGYYGDNDSETLTENSLAAHDFLASVCQKWEDEAKQAEKLGIRVAIPRVGIVLSNQGGALDKMLPIFSKNIGGVIGSGKQWMSWIHHQDLTNLYIYLLENENLQGVFNATAPEPVTNKIFSQTLAKSMGNFLFAPVPAIALKIMLGEMSALVIQGQKVSSQKIVNDGFQFHYPNLEKALEEICSPLKKNQKKLVSEQWINQKREDIFSFFSDEKNLEKMTPDFLGFKVLKKSTAQIEKGTLIDYRLKLYGVPMKWQTLIDEWQLNQKFVDTQVKGPYSKWHHTHEFIAVREGTLMRDTVLYKAPMGFLGDLIAGYFIKKNVEKIFAYRRDFIHDFYK